VPRIKEKNKTEEAGRLQKTRFQIETSADCPKFLIAKGKRLS